MKNMCKKLGGGVALVGTAVVTSPAFAYTAEAVTAIGEAKTAGETIAPLVIGAVAVIVGVSIVISMLRKA